MTRLESTQLQIGVNSLGSFSFRDNLFAIVDVDALLGFLVERATQQIEIAVGSVVFDGLYDRLDARDYGRGSGNVGVVENVERIGHIAVALPVTV